MSKTALNSNKKTLDFLNQIIGITQYCIYVLQAVRDRS